MRKFLFLAAVLFAMPVHAADPAPLATVAIPKTDWSKMTPQQRQEEITKRRIAWQQMTPEQRKAALTERGKNSKATPQKKPKETTGKRKKEKAPKTAQ